MLELSMIFELRNVYSPRFAESEICLPLSEYETETEHRKRTVLVYSHDFGVFYFWNELEHIIVS